MSRIGRLPVTVPSGVKVEIGDNNFVSVKGPKGQLSRTFTPEISIMMEGNQVIVQRSSDQPMHRALHGTTRALISNMITGVSAGFTKVMQVEGVGYRAEMNGKNLVLYVGYSHPVVIEPVEGISYEVDVQTRQVKVNGFDKELVGQKAAELRAIRPPEPYKGKGIRYLGERVRRKAGKAGQSK